jgi:hypothetical protein
MSEKRKQTVRRATSRQLTLAAVLSCTLLWSACAEDLTALELAEIEAEQAGLSVREDALTVSLQAEEDERYDDAVEASEVDLAAQVVPGWPGSFGGVGGTGGTATRPRTPSWPGTFGGVGGTAGPSTKPSTPTWPGTFGGVGGTSGKAPTKPSTPTWPGTFGGVGGTSGSSPKWPSIPGWPGTFGGVGGGAQRAETGT